MHGGSAHALGGGRCARGGPGRRGLHMLAMMGGPAGHGGPHAFGPWGGPGFGPPHGRRRRMRRGDVRAALLLLLAEEPRNGYGLMQEVERRSDGAWRPSPGSVYPALAQLEDEGLVRAGEQDGRKQFVLTDEGRAHVDEHREQLGEPWADLGEHPGGSMRDLRALVAQLAGAAVQVARAGDDAQVQRARSVLGDARRALYRILADDEETGTGEA